MARLRRTMSASASLPMRVPSFRFGIVVILSTISRGVVLSPFVSLASTAIRSRGASVWITREGADRDRVGCVEPIVLHDHDRTRLAGVVLATGCGPDLTALHSSTPVEIESMKA